MAQQHRVGKGNTIVSSDDGILTVTYHTTKVVVHDFWKRTITLNTGGYKTATTKTRMNQASNQYNLGYQVFQKRHSWFVKYQGKVYNFDEDSIILHSETIYERGVRETSDEILANLPTKPDRN